MKIISILIFFFSLINLHAEEPKKNPNHKFTMDPTAVFEDGPPARFRVIVPIQAIANMEYTLELHVEGDGKGENLKLVAKEAPRANNMGTIVGIINMKTSDLPEAKSEYHYKLVLKDNNGIVVNWTDVHRIKK